MCHAYSNICFLARCQDQATAFYLSVLHIKKTDQEISFDMF